MNRHREDRRPSQTRQKTCMSGSIDIADDESADGHD